MGQNASLIHHRSALCNLWSGVMEWSHGVEFWSGFLSGMEFNFCHPSRTGFYD